MSIRRFTSIKDNTISTALKADLRTKATLSNMGASDVGEIFSIYGQASTSSIEKSRILVQFPINEISNSIQKSEIPKEKATYKLKLFNSEHNGTTPRSFVVSVSPILQNWTEGTGLDMESYSDLGVSNWVSCSANTLWAMPGGTTPQAQDMEQSAQLSIPIEFTQTFDTGLEDLEIDITTYVDAWLKSYKNEASIASSSLSFSTSATAGDKIKLISTTGESKVFEYVASGTSSLGATGASNIVYVSAGTRQQSTKNLHDAINNYSPFSASMAHNATSLSVFQQEASYFGNTIISASQGFTSITSTNFKGGTGLPNRGLLIKLSGSQENGKDKKSYYTKKFFTRTSQYFFKRPVIEAQWNSSITDDRPNIYKSSSLMPGDLNLNTLYFYNYGPYGLVDIPKTGSGVVMQLYADVTSSLGASNLASPSAVSLVTTTPSVEVSKPTRVRAGHVSKGIYSASFAYSGPETALYDVWSTASAGAGTHLTQFFTGSLISVKERKIKNNFSIPQYVSKITNLKSSYSTNEIANFRVYTRNKNWGPNVYTVATNTAPSTVWKKSYYKITRTADKYEIIGYSTGSQIEYSKMSYDSTGSYFDLDMSILEPNYLYEIGLMYKEGNNFVEQPEKFRFRVDS